MLLKTRLRCQCLLKTRHSLHTYSLFKYHAGRRLVQRFPSSVDILFEKDHLYQAVIDLAPQPDVQWLAIEKSVAMVENSGLESQDPAAWMDLALSVQRKVSIFEEKREKKAVKSSLTKRFLTSSNASLRLIGSLDALGIDPRSSGPLGK
jgi:hypothetical protein